MMIKCANPQCDEEFFPKNPKQRYCSKECWYNANRPRLSKAETRKCANPNCGKEFVSNVPQQKYCCRKCADTHYRTIHAEQYKKPDPEPKTIKKRKTLEQWIKEARECNLDYGTYRALIAAGKTFNELKVNASRRTLQTHQKSLKRKRSD